MMDVASEVNAKTGGVVRIPHGNHTVTAPLDVKCSVIVEAGAVLNVAAPITMRNGSAWMTEGGMHTVVKAGAFNTFAVAGSNVLIDSVIVDEYLSLGGNTFYIDASVGCEKIRINKIQTYHSTGLIADGGQGIIVDMKLSDVKARQHRGRGSNLTRAFAYIFLEECTVDYINTLSVPSTNQPCWSFVGVEGLDLDKVDVLGLAHTGVCPDQWGFNFENVRALTIHQAMADNTGGFGFRFVDCNWIDANFLKASMCGGIGIVASNTQDLRVNILYLCGRKDLPGDTQQPMMWADERVENLHASQVLVERSWALHSGLSEQKFTASKAVFR